MSWDIHRGSNKSFTYILPMLGEKRSEFPGYAELVCFMGNNDYPELTKNIFILLKKKYITEEVSTFVESHKEYLNSYFPDDFHKMFIFSVPKIWSNSYDRFREGKYSMMADAYKRHIISFHNLKRNSVVAKVLYRSEEHYRDWEEKIGQEIDRNQEIGSLPNVKIEIYSDEMKLFKIDKEELNNLWKREV